MDLADGSLSLLLNTGTVLSIAPFTQQMSAIATYTIANGEISNDLDVIKILALLNPGMNLCVAAPPPHTNSYRQSATPKFGGAEYGWYWIGKVDRRSHDGELRSPFHIWRSLCYPIRPIAPSVKILSDRR
jgi:hypothetical protein